MKKYIKFGLYLVFGFTMGYFSKDFFEKPDQSYDKKKISIIEQLIRERSKDLSKKYDVQVSVKREQDKVVVFLWDKNVFYVNGWKMSKNGKKTLTELSHILMDINENLSVEIRSHYDSMDPLGIGNKEVNKAAVASYRASYIASALIGYGIKPENLIIKTLSDRAPLLKERNEKGFYNERAGNMNRRVELAVGVI